MVRSTTHSITASVQRDRRLRHAEITLACLAVWF